MWIFFNEGITQLKIPVLTSFLRTMWKVSCAGHRLTLKELVEGNQKEDTLSGHLQKAVAAGLIEKNRGKPSTTDGIFWRSTPNEYIPLNPTQKVWIAEYDEIDDLYSYSLLKSFGVKHTQHYTDKFDSIAPPSIHIEEVTENDRHNHYFADSIEAPHLGVPRCITYTQQKPQP